jgi:hypothetical protein
VSSSQDVAPVSLQQGSHTNRHFCRDPTGENPHTTGSSTSQLGRGEALLVLVSATLRRRTMNPTP